MTIFRRLSEKPRHKPAPAKSTPRCRWDCLVMVAVRFQQLHRRHIAGEVPVPY